jgi:hypothetical protein
MNIHHPATATAASSNPGRRREMKESELPIALLVGKAGDGLEICEAHPRAAQSR